MVVGTGRDDDCPVFVSSVMISRQRVPDVVVVVVGSGRRVETFLLLLVLLRGTHVRTQWTHLQSRSRRRRRCCWVDESSLSIRHDDDSCC